MRFADPIMLALLMLVPVLLVAQTWWNERISISFPGLRDIFKMPKTWAVRLQPLLPMLRILALIACIVALARPQWGLETTKIYSEGIAIAMVVDISSSMGAIDLEIDEEKVNRLDVVKGAFREFVEGDDKEVGGREGDLIGMFTFARYADSLSPLTLDHEALVKVLEEVKIVGLPEEDGTAIGDALVLAADELRNAVASSRVMILLTDGSNNAGDTSPVDAARVAEAFDVKVYTIGAGSQGQAMMPQISRDGSISYHPTQVYIDEYMLTHVAELTGGRYFRATDREGLRAIYTEIDRLETSTNIGEQYQRYTEGFPWVLALALMLLLSEVTLATTRFRRIP